MVKTDVKKALEASCGSQFINVSGIAVALGKSRDYARNLVHGLDYLPDGRAKNYLVSDVADRIMKRIAQ